MKKIILSLLILFSSSVFSAESMRRCMLLPIHDAVKGGIGFRIFENIERYLKEGDWCYYKSNSEIMNILGNYKNNLETYLANPDVIKVIAEKTKTGSIIKINVINDVSGVNIKVTIFSDNGRDIYFKEETSLKTDDLTIISQTIKNWLDIYEKTIPYDGRILGVLGDQFTTDIGKAMGNKAGTRVKVLRPRGMKKHPLLKEVVEWDFETIGSGRIFHVTASQAQGKMIEYTGRKRLRNEDWILFQNPKKVDHDKKYMFKKVKDYEFGKLGRATLFFTLGSGSITVQPDATTINKLGGLLFGIDFELQLWATRNYWFELDLGRKFGSYSKKEGSFTNATNSVSNSVTKIKLGYKYLPMGFFYGPQVDGFIGYARYGYGYDNSTADGITGSIFKGILVGARGSIPLKKLYRVFLALDFILGPKYEEDSIAFGIDDSTSNYSLSVGGEYSYSPNLAITAEFEVNSNKAKFKNPTKQVTNKDSSLKVGAAFTF